MVKVSVLMAGRSSLLDECGWRGCQLDLDQTAPEVGLPGWAEAGDWTSPNWARDEMASLVEQR